MRKMSRRECLKTMGAAGALGGGMIPLRNASAQVPAFTDYKALVCLFLYGGNDAFNMLTPTGSSGNTNHSTYSGIRGSLAVANNNLNLAGNFSGGLLSANPYNIDAKTETAYLSGLYPLNAQSIELGVNGVMPEMAQLITDGKMAIVANAGTLVEPVTRAEIKAKTANLPLFLFAHNHQQRALQTGQADNLNDTGWAGRIADIWQGVNGDTSVPLNISYQGNDRLLIGETTTPLALKTGVPVYFTEMNNLGSASHRNRRDLFHALTASNPRNGRFKELYNNMLNKSLDMVDVLDSAWDKAVDFDGLTGSYGEPLFDVPDMSTLQFDDTIKGSLISQLEAVAKMAYLGKNELGFKRQIFFVSQGGYDTHGSQATNHPRLLRALSLALWKFQKAMESLSMQNDVTLFSLSDFGRTITNNGDGTDHAWGSYQVAMGGAVDGGKLYGTIPDLTPDGPDDYSAKGRIIPTTAVDQCNATLASWFGVEDAMMPSIFPNLKNFKPSPSDPISAAYLNFMR